MKHYIFSILLLWICTFTGYSQPSIFSKLYKPGSTLYVHALQGLSMREATDLKAKALLVVPYGGEVEVVADTKPKVPITNSNISGNWVKVKQGNNVGYMFDGFLSRFKIMDPKQINTSYSIGDYLKSYFKSISDVNKAPDGSAADYRKIIFQNGTIYEYQNFEGGITMSATFPITVITFQEMYHLARQSNSIFFTGKGCDYKAENMSCNYENEMANLALKRQGANYIMVFQSAD